MTKIGEIPDEWEITRVKDICKKPEYGFTQSAQAKPVGPKFLRITDIQDGKVDWNIVPYCECPDSLKSKYILKPGDILFARTGATTGKSYLVKNPPEAVYASYLIRVVTKENMDAQFLYSLFNSNIYWRQITKNIAGSSQGGVNATLLSEIKLPFPPLPEQHRIASILSNIDEAIQKTQQIIDQSQRVKQGLMQELLTKGIGHTKFKESLLGEIPDEWELVTLKTFLMFIKSGISRPFKNDDIGIPVLRSSNVINGKIILYDVKFWYEKDPRGADTSSIILQDKDIIMNFVNGSIKELGKCAIYKNEIKPCIISTNFFIIRFSEALLPEYFNIFALSDLYHRQIVSHARKGNQGSFNKEDVKRIKIPLPSNNEQKEIINIFINLDDKMIREAKYKEELEHVKKGLMQVLLTGKVRVKIDT